jgi:tetratricopeptide (TPR) repeat protein
LGAALAEFGRLEEMLNKRQDTRNLTEYEQKALRNAYFAQGGVLFDWATVDHDPQRFEEAIQKYSSATNRYQNEPESLQAFVQIASCYRQLGRHPEARATIMQAQMVLSRMPEDADYAAVTGYGREEWVSLLGLFATM